MTETKYIWLNGKLIAWKDANTHIMTHTLHYGSGAFEGIRFYETKNGPAIFRLKEHVDRLFATAEMIKMKIPFTKKQIFDAIVLTVKNNKIKSGYIRPICYFGYGLMGLDTSKCTVDVAIACWPWGAYLGDEALKHGIKTKISTDHKRVFGPLNKAKINGNYYNSSLAKFEAKNEGYEECIMLDDRGFIAEATGENLFIIKNSVIITPKEGSILLGITRNSLMTIAKDLGYKVVEKNITKKDLLSADEAFLCGTAAELTPIQSINGKKLKRIDITLKIQKAYFDIVRGENKKYFKWLTVVK